MKALINNIKFFLEAAITAGDISAGSIKDKNVFKGFENDPEKISLAAYPYIAIDDGGEEVRDAGSNTGQLRIFKIILEIGVKTLSRTASLDDLLDLTQEVREEMEKEKNRQKDDLNFGVSIDPFEGPAEEQFCFRGRQILIEYEEIEDKRNQF